jgi:hypothetical protein
LNTYEVLKYKFLVLKQSSVKKIEELLKWVRNIKWL